MTAQSFAAIAKDLTAASVHTPTALGNDKPKKKAKTFRAFVGQSEAFERMDSFAKRQLQPNDADTAKSPFLYDVNAMGNLRPDQVPRFFGALTDSGKLPDAEVALSDLHAMQDRVDPKKVEAMRGKDVSATKKPVVVKMNGKHYIADGHHRLAADWLDGKEMAQVKIKDLSDVSNLLKERDQFKVAKVDESLGLVFGFGIICKMDGQDYYDWNVDHAGPHKGKLVPEHITEAAMLKSATWFAMGERPGNVQHEGPDVGTYPFVFPLTEDIAKAMGITEYKKSGLMVAYKPPKDVLAKFLDGSLTGFSIEGMRLPGETVEHD